MTPQERPTSALPQRIPSHLSAGKMVQGRYELLRPIGDGGVGFVMAARHAGFNELVALKFLKPEYATNKEAVIRFMTEARTGFRLNSEHIVRVLDVDIYEGTPFMAMELLSGSDLRDLRLAHHQFDVPRAVDCILQVCEALSFAHAIGVIHRDIKPENLFISTTSTGQDRVKVLDFGISKVGLLYRADPRRESSLQLTQVAVGTPPYMSPEQVRSAQDIDVRSDIWAVGCVLYELVTGISPFERGSSMQSCAAVLEEDPLPAWELRHALPCALSDAIMRCLRKAPRERFADVAELAEAISPFGSGRFLTYPARCRVNLLEDQARKRQEFELPLPTVGSLGLRSTASASAAALSRSRAGLGSTASAAALSRSDAGFGSTASAALSRSSVREVTPLPPVQFTPPAHMESWNQGSPNQYTGAVAPNAVRTRRSRSKRLLVLGGLAALAGSGAGYMSPRLNAWMQQPTLRSQVEFDIQPHAATDATQTAPKPYRTPVSSQLPQPHHPESMSPKYIEPQRELDAGAGTARTHTPVKSGVKPAAPKPRIKRHRAQATTVPASHTEHAQTAPTAGRASDVDVGF